MFRTFLFYYKVALFYNSVYFIFMKSFIYHLLSIIFSFIVACIVFDIQKKTGFSSGNNGIDLFIYVVGAGLIYMSMFCVLDLFRKGSSGIDKPYLLIMWAVYLIISGTGILLSKIGIPLPKGDTMLSIMIAVPVLLWGIIAIASNIIGKRNLDKRCERLKREIEERKKEEWNKI